MAKSNFEYKRILITGGQGLVGTYLSNKLLSKGHKVSILSRTRKEHSEMTYYSWDSLAKEDIENFDSIVHLAGSSIAQRWSTKNKKLIYDSRVGTCKFLYNLVDQSNVKPSSFISASGVGFYGASTSNQIMDESQAAASDFLGGVCRDWEESANRFHLLGVRTVNLRTGVVLSKTSQIVKSLRASVRWGMGAAFGTGKQYFPWIHIEDLCNMYIKAIEDQEMEGVYNAVAPEFISNKALVALFSKVLKKPYWLPNIPVFILKSVLGEMSVLLTEGSRISSNKIEAAGFRFRFPTAEQALTDVLHKNSE